MPKITQVEPQKNNPYRFNIFLDGQFAFGADKDTIVNYRLIIDKEISPEDLPKILQETEVGLLMGRMYNLFNIRQRSEKEVRDYLKRLSFKRKIKERDEISELVINEVVNKLKQKGLLNDQQFAASWIESRRRSKKKGANTLKAELFQKGIDREVIVESLNEISPESEEQLAKEALQKKLKVWKNLPELQFKKKALDFLVRRGFEYSIAKNVIDYFLNTEQYSN